MTAIGFGLLMFVVCCIYTISFIGTPAARKFEERWAWILGWVAISGLGLVAAGFLRWAWVTLP